MLTPVERLSDEDILRVPPMLLGSIRWKKALGRPKGDLCSGFRIIVDERTPTEFQMGPAGPEIVPGTPEWRRVTNSAPCTAVPDMAESHVVTFSVSDLHLSFLDGRYRVTPQLTDSWDKSLVRYLIGLPRVEPRYFDFIRLTRDKPVESLEFEVILESWLRFSR